MDNNFRVGDLVEVVYLPPSMDHFDKGVALICGYSRNTCQLDSDWEHNYSLCFICEDEYNPELTTSWYPPSSLKMIEKGLAHKFKESKDERT